MKKPFIFSCLMLYVLGTLICLPSAFSGDIEDSDIETHPRLQESQAQVSQAFGDYFKALMSGSAEQKKNAEDALNQASASVNRVLSEQHDKELKTIYGKVYFSDGRVVNGEEYKKNPEKFDLPETSPATQAGSTRPSSGGSASLILSNPSPSSTPNKKEKEDSSHPEWALDGSNVPKELVFSGKKTPAAEPARKPAPSSSKKH